MPFAELKPYCLNCTYTGFISRRNLCQKCYRCPEIRSKYPPRKSRNVGQCSKCNTALVIVGKKMCRNCYQLCYWHEKKTEAKLKQKRDAARLYSQSHKQIVSDRGKKWRESNREIVAAMKKKYAVENKDKINSYQRTVFHKYRERVRAYVANRRKEDIQFRIKMQLRSRLHSAIRGQFRRGSAVRDLGCTIPEFIDHIAKKFQPGMSWDNWGRDTWHLDHIQPLTSFDLTKRRQLLKAFHYSNYQPLWAVDNLSKNDRLDWVKVS